MTVILVDPRRPTLVPVDAVELLMGEVQYTEEMPVKVPWSLPSARPVLAGDSGQEDTVLLSSDPSHPAVVARIKAGEPVIAAPPPRTGEKLLDAVAIMDRLRTDGPWESEQTHDSLRRYLLEETYELFDAVRGGDTDELRDELGDVLLQVLFHARIAEDATDKPFSIDDVADALVRKLRHRAPAVLAGESISLADQLAQWEERKAREKLTRPRESVVADLPTSQPALALAQKVISRAQQAGVPAEVIPSRIIAITLSADVDAESALRSAVLEFMDDLRSAEQSVAAARGAGGFGTVELGTVTEDEWRAAWPAEVGDVITADELVPVSDDDDGVPTDGPG
jgi:XTP/dITP diphosphohydrolase